MPVARATRSVQHKGMSKYAIGGIGSAGLGSAKKLSHMPAPIAAAWASIQRVRESQLGMAAKLQVGVVSG